MMKTAVASIGTVRNGVSYQRTLADTKVRPAL